MWEILRNAEKSSQITTNLHVSWQTNLDVIWRMLKYVSCEVSLNSDKSKQILPKFLQMVTCFDTLSKICSLITLFLFLKSESVFTLHSPAKPSTETSPLVALLFHAISCSNLLLTTNHISDLVPRLTRAHKLSHPKIQRDHVHVSSYVRVSSQTVNNIPISSTIHQPRPRKAYLETKNSVTFLHNLRGFTRRVQNPRRAVTFCSVSEWRGFTLNYPQLAT